MPRRGSSPESIAYSRLIDQKRRATRITFDLLPQPSHRHTKVFDIAQVRLAPDRLKKMTVSQNLAGMADEFEQERELLRRQVHGGAVPGYPMRPGIYFNRAGP